MLLEIINGNDGCLIFFVSELMFAFTHVFINQTFDSLSDVSKELKGTKRN